MTSSSDLSMRLARALEIANTVQLSGDDQELLDDLSGDAAIILKDSGSFRAETVLPLCQELESIIENHATNAAIDSVVTGRNTSPVPSQSAPSDQESRARSPSASARVSATSLFDQARSITFSTSSTPEPKPQNSSAPRAPAHLPKYPNPSRGKPHHPAMPSHETTAFLTSATFKTLLPTCPTIIKAPEPHRWIELRCSICGGNATRIALTPLRGLVAFSTHLRYFHGVKRPSEEATMKRCTVREVDEGEVREILEVGSAGGSFVGLVGVSREKREREKVGSGGTDRAGRGGEVVENYGKKVGWGKRKGGEDEEEYVGGTSAANTTTADGTSSAADTNARRSSRIADMKRAAEQDGLGPSAVSAARKPKRVRDMSEEGAGENIDRLWWDVEQRIYQTEQDVWLADLNAKAKDEGLLEGRRPYDGEAAGNREGGNEAETDDAMDETA
ncbi:hypothetical protein BST61_g10315 [Cercospora zeina]